MRLAIVFDDLIQNGGAERLLLTTLEVFPDAILFTPLATTQWENVIRQKGIILKTSFMQKLPLKKRLNRFYSVFGFHILAFESFDFSDFDVVLSVSARFAHGIVTKPGTKHICYMNSPGRMFWDTNNYFRNENFLVRILRFAINPFISHVRNWDFVSSRRVDYFVSNSPASQKRVKKYYGRESEVIFPPVSFPKEKDISPESQGDYFLILSRLLAWKKIDIAIKACVDRNLNLRIVGDGPARHDLENLARNLGAAGCIKFEGYVSEDEKWSIIRNCKALIMTQEEDFGISPIEAMYVGKPVIAYKRGGALSYVLSGVTGIFFDKQDSESLADALGTFNEEKFSPKECNRQAQKFAKEKFQEKIRDVVNNVYYRNI